MSSEATIDLRQAVGLVALAGGLGLSVASNYVIYAAGATAMAAALYLAISIISYSSMISQFKESESNQHSMLAQLLTKLWSTIPTIIIGIPVTAILFGTASWLTSSFLPVALAFKMSGMLWSGLALIYSGDLMISLPPPKLPEREGLHPIPPSSVPSNTETSNRESFLATEALDAHSDDELSLYQTGSGGSRLI